MRKLTCDPKIEVLGAPLIANIENINADEIMPYLRKHHLDHVNPDKWYPLIDFLDVLNDMAEGHNLSSRLVGIGVEIFRTIKMPPELEHASLPEILNTWNDLYHMQHRGGDIGYVKVEQVDSTHYKTIHKNLYPDDMLYGVAYGMARRFAPKGSNYKVYYDEKVQRADDGGKETVIHIQW